jgi:hypothetical protein
MPLDDPSGYATQAEWMKYCMHEMTQNHPHDQALAACLETWRKKSTDSTETKADISPADFSSRTEFMTHCLTMHDQQTCDIMWADHMSSGAPHHNKEEPKKGVSIRQPVRTGKPKGTSHVASGAVSIKDWIT